MNIDSRSRQILIHGMLFVLVGFLWGLVVPATPHPRLALGAHVQFEINGMLFIVLATVLLTLPHQVGRKSVLVMLVAVWLTWAMALSEAANAWWGTSQMLPIAAAQAGVTGGQPWQEIVVKLAHIVPGVGLIVGWSLLILGFVKQRSETAA